MTDGGVTLGAGPGPGLDAAFSERTASFGVIPFFARQVVVQQGQDGQWQAGCPQCGAPCVGDGIQGAARALHGHWEQGCRRAWLESPVPRGE